MDVKTILTTLAALGASTILMACRTGADITEVPGPSGAAQMSGSSAEASCGKSHAVGDADVDPGEASDAVSSVEAASRGADARGDADTASTVVRADASTPSAAAPVPAATPTRANKARRAPKGGAKAAEEKCGEGTCG